LREGFKLDGSGSDRKQLSANKLDEIEEVDAYAPCSFDFERWAIGRKPNLKVENMYYRSNTLYLLIQ
jgi:hypothetical protein